VEAITSSGRRVTPDLALAQRKYEDFLGDQGRWS
jgi:hypothetical protein